ncbi:hypothetical protein AwErysi_07070 [Erysipelotrichaceae bacterium]|nr:hypothetical protein AwErysi_07070 [Erysipelotrichaceae bacterium]
MRAFLMKIWLLSKYRSILLLQAILCAIIVMGLSFGYIEQVQVRQINYYIRRYDERNMSEVIATEYELERPAEDVAALLTDVLNNSDYPEQTLSLRKGVYIGSEGTNRRQLMYVETPLDPENLPNFVAVEGYFPKNNGEVFHDIAPDELAIEFPIKHGDRLTYEGLNGLENMLEITGNFSSFDEDMGIPTLFVNISDFHEMGGIDFLKVDFSRTDIVGNSAIENTSFNQFEEILKQKKWMSPTAQKRILQVGGQSMVTEKERKQVFGERLLASGGLIILVATIAYGLLSWFLYRKNMNTQLMLYLNGMSWKQLIIFRMLIAYSVIFLGSAVGILIFQRTYVGVGEFLQEAYAPINIGQRYFFETDILLHIDGLKITFFVLGAITILLLLVTVIEVILQYISNYEARYFEAIDDKEWDND